MPPISTIGFGLLLHGVDTGTCDLIRYEVAIECNTRVVEHKFAHVCLIPEEYMSDVVYDASVKGIASMLHSGHHVALERVSSILSYITHGIIEPCKATISKFIKEFAVKSLPEYVAVLKKSLDPSVKYTDATHITVNGHRAYIRNISTNTSVLYEFLPKNTQAQSLAGGAVHRKR